MLKKTGILLLALIMVVFAFSCKKKTQIKGISLDVSFSDEVWMELLPKLYATKHQIPLGEAKRYLKETFSSLGRYDKRYYVFQYWLESLDLKLSWDQITSQIASPPHLYEDMTKLVKQLCGKVPLIIFSATTRDFIEHEISPLKSSFTQIISAIDDLGIPGKTPEEVTKEVMQWIQDEKITVELDHGDLILGRLGNPSGLGLVAPRYFEITIKSEPNGVMVHTEGWVSVFDFRELSFVQRGVITGAVPRRLGWTVMEKLWNRLENMTN